MDTQGEANVRWPWEKITLNCFSLSNQQSPGVWYQSSVAGIHSMNREGEMSCYINRRPIPRPCPVPSSIQARWVGIFWLWRQFLPHWAKSGKKSCWNQSISTDSSSLSPGVHQVLHDGWLIWLCHSDTWPWEVLSGTSTLVQFSARQESLS